MSVLTTYRDSADIALNQGAAMYGDEDEGAPWTWVVFIVMGLVALIWFHFWNTRRVPTVTTTESTPATKSVPIEVKPTVTKTKEHSPAPR